MDPNALSTDVQQALQHAIGQLNDAFEQSTRKHNNKGKKSDKKRVRPEQDSENDGKEMTTKKKKKVKSKDSRSRSASYAVQSESQSEAVAQEQEEEDEEEINPPRRSESSHKKKRSKGKQKANAPSTTSQSETSDVVIDPLLTSAAANANANDTADPNTSAAFISALLAAASATADPQQQPEQSTSIAVPASEPTQFPLSDAQFPQYFEHAPPGFPGTLPGAAFPDPSMFLAPGHGHTLDPASLQTFNEDLVRALQELDVAKLSAMLKGLGDAAAQLQGLSAFPSIMTDGGAGQVPVSSSALLGHRPKNTSNRDASANQPESKQPQRSTAVTMPVPLLHPADQNLNHAHVLATRWMSAGKLAQMVRDEGLVYKKGKFSSAEEGAIKQAINHYQLSKGLADEQLNEIIFAKGPRKKDTAFWSEITSQIPQRPIIAVYHHVRRTYHPMRAQGAWMPSEDDSLRIAVADCGQAWEKVSSRVGRMAADCRDRWRNHLEKSEFRVSGPWSKEEEDLLTHIVTQMTVAKGKDQDNDVFWGIVSEKMGNKRGRQQCRIKWTDSLSKTVKNEGRKPRWSQQDAYILVHKIASLNVRDDTEIDWKLLIDPDWNLWSAHSLQRRWLTLKRSIKGHEEMGHQDIMDILRLKKSEPPPASPPRKNKITSSAIVEQYHEIVIDPKAISGYVPTSEYAPTINPTLVPDRLGEDESDDSADEEEQEQEQEQAQGQSRDEGSDESSSSSDSDSDSSDSD